MTHCGNDGYLYLLFQRNILVLSVQLTAISLLMSICLSIAFPPQEDEDQEGKGIIGTWLDVTFLDNR